MFRGHNSDSESLSKPQEKHRSENLDDPRKALSKEYIDSTDCGESCLTDSRSRHLEARCGSSSSSWKAGTF